MIYFFLGDFNPEPSTWLLDPHLAAHSGIFASSRQRIDSGGCGNCKAQQLEGRKYADTVALTPALLHFHQTAEEIYGLKVDDLSPEVVVPFLTRNLHWRVIKVSEADQRTGMMNSNAWQCSGGHVPREEIPSLKVGVYSETVHLPRQLTDAPAFENQVVHYDITAGRPSGCNSADDW